MKQEEAAATNEWQIMVFKFQKLNIGIKMVPICLQADNSSLKTLEYKQIFNIFHKNRKGDWKLDIEKRKIGKITKRERHRRSRVRVEKRKKEIKRVAEKKRCRETEKQKIKKRNSKKRRKEKFKEEEKREFSSEIRKEKKVKNK